MVIFQFLGLVRFSISATNLKPCVILCVLDDGGSFGVRDCNADPAFVKCCFFE